MLKIVFVGFILLNLFSLNLLAKDSRSSISPRPPESIEAPVEFSALDLFSKKNTFDQILSDKKFIEKFNSLTTALNSQWSSIGEDLRRRASKEIDRYNISTVFGLQGNSIKLLGSSLYDIETSIGQFDIEADLYYRIEIRPSFIQGKQVRKDIYVIGLKGGSTISAGAQVRVTFFREFDSKAKALFAGRPYGLSEIPRNSDDILTKLKVKDSVRIEAFGNLEISDKISDISKTANLSAVLGYDLFQGLFLLDVFKLTENDVRARFMGTINRGTLKGGVALDLMSNFKLGGILNRLFNHIFEFNFDINASKSFNFFDEYPIETHVVDYFFRFNTGASPAISLAKACQIDSLKMEEIHQDNRPLTSEAAFDELLANVNSGRFLALFNPKIKESALSIALLKNATLAETIACQDKDLPNEKRRVLHFFKGRMAADIASLDFGPKISQLLRKKVTQGHSEIFVASVQQNQDFNYYLLMNSFLKNENSYVFGRWEDDYRSDFDALYLSNKNKEIQHFLDFVKRIQYKDKLLTTSDLRGIEQTVNRSIPSHFPDRQKLLDLIPKTEQVDGVISLVYALSDKVIYAIEKMDKLTLYNSLYAYLDKHPHRHLMNIPSDNSSETGQTFNDYVNDLYFQIVRFADSGSPQKERYTALKNLVYNQTFTDYVFIEFLPTLIPANIAMDAMSLKMSVASNSIALTEVKIGNNQYSSVYSAVLLLRSILNDRSLDLRLESIISDTEITNGNPMTIQGFKIAD